MAHTTSPGGTPGIVGQIFAHRESEEALNTLAQVVMCGPSPLTRAERELIAAVVSAGNDSYFCTNTHAAAARHLFGDRAGVVDAVLTDPGTGHPEERLRALLAIAAKVRRGGCSVTPDDVARARAAGADDREVHDTVLIAAMLCMFNRYVDNFGPWAPRDPSVYQEIGARIATTGDRGQYPDEPVVVYAYG